MRGKGMKADLAQPSPCWTVPAMAIGSHKGQVQAFGRILAEA